MSDYRNNPIKCEHKQTRVVTRADLDPLTYALIKADMLRHRQSFGKGFDGSCSKQLARQGLYWVTSHSNDPDDLTIEQYITIKRERSHV